MIKYTIVFLAGVYIGQEYGYTIPNVKGGMIQAYDKFKNTELYKKIRDDLNKNK
jgi:hypothetical protein